MAKKNDSIIELPQTKSRIGPKTTYIGELSFSTSMSILGVCNGEIYGGELLVIHPLAKVDASIRAEYVLVAGIVSGIIYARKGVYFYSGAKIKCSVSSLFIRMQAEVDFEGECNLLNKKNIDIFSASLNEFKAYLVDKISHKNEEDIYST